MTNNAKLWDSCLEVFRRVLSEKQMKTWLLPLEVNQDDKTLNVLAPNKFIQDSVQKNYFALIKDTVSELSSNKIERVLLSLSMPAPPSSVSSPSPLRKSIFASANLNSGLVFANFVEGKSNQLAKAAALSIVAGLGQYNPLYIYGGVGLGKTHLLHAIGNEIIKKSPKKRVAYLHSERFVQNMVSALRHGKIEDFKNYYRSVDALLLDDIQFLLVRKGPKKSFSIPLTLFLNIKNRLF